MLKTFSFEVPGFQGQTGFRLVRADTAELADFVYRFRYHIYVELMARRQRYACHLTGSIREPLDDLGHNYLAIKDGAVVGTIRRNMLDDAATNYYARLYKSGLFETVHPSDIAITTKLMVIPHYRSTPITTKLISNYADCGYRDGVRLELLDCNKPLVPFFERMGYFSYIGWTFHSEYGTVRPMFLAPDILDYLERIGSFLREPARRHVRDNQYGGYSLVERFAEAPWTARIRDISRDLRARV